jgi:hypothetical protein
LFNANTGNKSMKKLSTLTCAVAVILSGTWSQGKDVKSPDGRFAVRAEASITLVDSAGDQILSLVRDTIGDTKVEVAWSPDSRHVVVVENGARDSAIIGAWRDQVWHKTIEVDEDRAPIRKDNARVIAEHRKLAGWLTPSEVSVIGDMMFSNGGKYKYGYTLSFRPGPVRLDRGGYEEGAIVGHDYKIL